MNNKTMTINEWLLLLVLSLLWGGSFFFNEIILRELHPFTMVFARSFVAAAMLLVLVFASGREMPKSLKVWGAFLIMGFLNNLVPFSLIVWGQQHIDSGLASILNATTPLFSVILGHFLTTDEKLNVNKIMGIVFGLVGVVILVGPDTLRGIGAQGLAQIAILMASLSYAIAGVFGRRFQNMEPIVSSAGMLTCTAVMMLPLAWWVDRPQSLSFTLSTWGSVLAQALLSTVIAYLIYFRILKTAGATNVLLVTFLIPVSALLLGVLALGEVISWSLLVGMVLIFIGLIVVDGRLLKSRSSAT